MFEDDDFDKIAKNQNGNFVIQYLIELSRTVFANESNYSNIINIKMVPKLNDFIKHKFGSRVVQSCFEYMSEPYKIEMLREISSKNDFIVSMNDPNIYFVYMKIIKLMGKFDTNRDMLKINDSISINVMKMYKDEKFSKMVA